MKIRLPIRKPAAPAKRPPKLKLKASVASRRRAPLVVEEEDEFLEEPEPNMKLSHAFVVVLVLHVIAVAGVFAFNSIKARQTDKVFASAEATAPAAPAPENAAPAPAADPAPATTTASHAPAPAAAPAPTATGRSHPLQPGETLTKVAAQYGVTVAALEAANGITDPTKIRAGADLVIPAADPAAPAPKVAAPAAPTTPSTVKDSGEIYTVAKGDNPVKIAKKLKVPYADLMALNGNPDPRKLQIGQKFKVPAHTQP